MHKIDFMKVASYDVVFQEVPGEVTLALNLSGCPNLCQGCHSPHLREDIGEVLDEGLIDGLLATYGHDITCVCFMGGDRDPGYVMKMAEYIHKAGLKTAWYSGRQKLPECFNPHALDFVKVGPYIPEFGPLPSPTTNQRMYRIEGSELIDITCKFRKS